MRSLRLSTVLRPTVRPWIVLALIWLILATGLALAAGELARRQAEDDLARQAQAGAALHAAVLRSELEKHRSLPLVLAQDPEVIALLAQPLPTRTDQVDRKLERLASQTRAAVIYLLDTQGVARAASNWRLPTSFVGQDYSFRPYFTRAMASGDAEFFALGTVSGRPGLYLARRIMDPRGRATGVVVVKVEFDALEADWAGSGEPAYVADPSGVILITSVPDWRFRTISPMTAAQRRQVLTGQTLGHDALTPLPFRATSARPRLVTADVDAALQDGQTSWMAAQADTATPGWTLHLLSPAGTAILVAVSNARAVALLGVTLIMGGVGILLRRRQLAVAQGRAEVAARADLERRIDERTVELRAANDELNREIEERLAAEASREMLRDELVQANKLATLGQIAAGVAHEINQPVAAIRMSADTTLAYLDRADDGGVRRTVARIAELTHRIGAITDELRAFSRKTASQPSAVSPDEAIDGALVLLTGRLRDSRMVLTRTRAPTLRVLAEKIRLEQVILNLVQNAIEAMEEANTVDARLNLSVTATPTGAEIVIRDNGPGLNPEVSDALFTPFVTTKATGLGLGLVICRDIVSGFGGELNVRPCEVGAAFVIALKAA